MYKAFNKIVVDAIKEYAVYDCNDSSRVVAWEPLKPGTLDESSAIKRLGTHFDKVTRRISGENVSATNRHFNRLEAAVIMEVLKSILLEDGIFHDILMEKDKTLAPAVFDRAVPHIIDLYYKHIVSKYTGGQLALFPCTLKEREHVCWTERIYLTAHGYLTYSSILDYVQEHGVNVEDLFRIHSTLLKKECHQIIDQFFDDTKSLVYEGRVGAFHKLKEGLEKTIPNAKDAGLLCQKIICADLGSYVDSEGEIHWPWESEFPDLHNKTINKRKPPR